MPTSLYCSLNSEKSPPPSFTILRWQHQKCGGNGGITITGTVGSILGGTVIGIVYYITLLTLLTICRIIAVLPQWPIILIGCLGGFLGSAFDSILGATLQYSGYCSVKKCVVHKPSPTVKHISGRAILDNHAVNFLSSLLISVVPLQNGFWNS